MVIKVKPLHRAGAALRDAKARAAAKLSAAAKTKLAKAQAAVAKRRERKFNERRMASPGKLKEKWRNRSGGGGGPGQPALAGVSGGGKDATKAIGRPESKSGVTQMAGRPPLSSLVRVSAPGGRVGKLGTLKADADVPSHYRTDPARFTKLAEDPDHAGQVSEKTRAEAMAGLEAEHQKLVTGKITRGGKGIEFHDATGTPYDVKTPISPPVGAKWPFPTQKAAASVVDELRKKVQSPLGLPSSPPGEYLNPVTNAFEPRWVILDSSYMNVADHAALWQELNKTLTLSEQGRVIEVNTRP